MTTATQEAPAKVLIRGKKMRFQLMASKHYMTQTIVRADGTTFESDREFNAHDPTCNIIETDIDLAERYNSDNPPSEKFRRLPDPEVQLRGFGDDAFVAEAVKRGLLTKEEAELRLGTASQQPKDDTPPPVVPATNVDKKPHAALANLGTMPTVGLRKLAEDEEIDLAGCKNDQQMRETIAKALKSR